MRIIEKEIYRISFSWHSYIYTSITVYDNKKNANFMFDRNVMNVEYEIYFFLFEESLFWFEIVCIKLSILTFVKQSLANYLF